MEKNAFWLYKKRYRIVYVSTSSLILFLFLLPLFANAATSDERPFQERNAFQTGAPVAFTPDWQSLPLATGGESATIGNHDSTTIDMAGSRTLTLRFNLSSPGSQQWVLDIFFDEGGNLMPIPGVLDVQPFNLLGSCQTHAGNWLGEARYFKRCMYGPGYGNQPILISGAPSLHDGNYGFIIRWSLADQAGTLTQRVSNLRADITVINAPTATPRPATATATPLPATATATRRATATPCISIDIVNRLTINRIAPTSGPRLCPTPRPSPTTVTVPTAIPTDTSMPTEVPIPTAVPTDTPIPTDTPVPTAIPTRRPTVTPCISIDIVEGENPQSIPGTPRPRVCPTARPLPTARPTLVPTDTPIPTEQLTEQPTETPIPTDTPIPTEQPTDTPVLTETIAATEQPNDTATPTSSPVKTRTPTRTRRPTNTPESMPSPTETQAPSEAQTPTKTRRPTKTPETTPVQEQTPVPTGESTSTPEPTGTVDSVIKINFQPAPAAIPNGYIADTGAVFGSRNGLRYGWSRDMSRLARDRNRSRSPDQRYDTLIYMMVTKDDHTNYSKWELALPEGRYRVHLVVGDPIVNSRVPQAVNAEGISIIRGALTSGQRWLEGTATVEIEDGRLTLEAGALNYNEGLRVCFIEVTPLH